MDDKCIVCDTPVLNLPPVARFVKIETNEFICSACVGFYSHMSKDDPRRIAHAERQNKAWKEFLECHKLQKKTESNGAGSVE